MTNVDSDSSSISEERDGVRERSLVGSRECTAALNLFFLLFTWLYLDTSLFQVNKRSDGRLASRSIQSDHHSNLYVVTRDFSPDTDDCDVLPEERIIGVINSYVHQLFI